MPLLYSLGQHGALQDVSRRFRRGEHLFAFLDDTYIVCKLARVAPIYGFLESALIWNQAGIRPDICDALERSAQAGPVPGFGVGPWCQLTDKASSCSGRPWVTLTTWPDTSNPLCKSTASFWKGSHASRICRVLGFSCCIVHQLGPTTCFVQWTPTGLVNSHEPMPGVARQGWQRGAAQHVEERFRTDIVWPRFDPPAGFVALSEWAHGRRSFLLLPHLHGDPFRTAGVPHSSFEAPLVSVTSVLSKLPVWPSTRSSWPPPSRGFPIESAVARVCREAGGRATTNVRVQDVDIPPGAAPDNRRLEVVVDGLPLFHGEQLAVDATMVSPVRRDGTVRRQCAMTDGAAMTQARRRKERTHPELAQVHGRARLVVVVCEVGGRWSGEALSFVHSLSKAKARSEPEEFREGRWSSLLACAAARAFALTLLERRCTPGFDGSGPTSSEVHWDHRCEV